MNELELRAEIVRNGMTIPTLADKIGIGKNALYRKLCGKTAFTQREIANIAVFLNLNTERMVSIFFSEIVS